MAVINATELIIMNSTVAVEGLTNCTISLNVETRDVTTKDSAGWRELLEGVRSWSGSGECLVDRTATEGYEELYDDTVARIPVTIKFTSQQTGDMTLTGSVILNTWEMSGGVEDNVTLSYSFEGTGAITKAAEL